mgnify:CR=1 FL=1
MNEANRLQATVRGREGMLASLLLIVLFLAGCGGGQGPPVRTELVPFTPDQQAALVAARDAEYRIRTGDRLAVDFKYEDELDSSRLLVLPDGRLTLPGGVAPVVARGLSVTQLDSALTALYGRDYRQPDLSVIIEDLADLYVYVFGNVKSPGQVELPDRNLGLLQAIASAGGFDEDAAVSETVVIRATAEGFMLRRINLSHLERRGIPSIEAMDLQPFDIIYVPRGTVGDIAYFSDTVLRGLLNVTRLFWDIYAVGQINKVTTLYR